MKIDRLIAIIMVLLDQDQVPAKYLADMFEVSTRTIYRDLDSINQAGIPIVAVSGPGNGISILKSYKVEKRLFSTNDITTLLMALGSIQSNLPDSKITTTIAKIKGMIPKNSQKEFHFKTNQIKIDLTPWLYSGNELEKIQLIKVSMEQQNILRFEYKDKKNKRSVRKIEPYCLLLKGEYWYVQGYCLLRNDFRTFKVLRMKNISIMDSTFEPKEFPSKKTTHFNDKKITQVKLRVHESVTDKIISRFGEECLTIDSPEHYIATVQMPIDELAFDYLLGFGTKCECIEPPKMRQELDPNAPTIPPLYAARHEGGG